jgi:hypothetical protein
MEWRITGLSEFQELKFNSIFGIFGPGYTEIHNCGVRNVKGV